MVLRNICNILLLDLQCLFRKIYFEATTTDSKRLEIGMMGMRTIHGNEVSPLHIASLQFIKGFVRKLIFTVVVITVINFVYDYEF